MGKFFSVALLLICIGSKVADAQNLSPGDIAIVGMNAVNPDEFAFVLLVDIPAGTQITFADHGWLAVGEFRPFEDEYVYTATNTVARGTVIRVDDAAGSPQFAQAGDQLFAYQGTTGNPSFIYGLNVEGAGVWQTDAVSSNTSALPPTLQNGLTAVAVDECNNVVYSGATTGTKSELLELIGNKVNWACDDVDRLDLGLTFTVSGAGNNIPVFTNVFADSTILIDTLFDFTFEASDADSDPLEYSIAPTPEAGANFDTATGRFTWTPSLAQVGDYAYTVSVNDGTDTAVLQISLKVVEILGPTAPIFTSGAETHIFNVGETVSITLVAEDPQGTDVTIELIQEPFICVTIPCAVWDSGSNTISWSADAPDIFSFVVRATDGANEITDAEVIIGQIGELYSGSPTRDDLFNAVAGNGPLQTLGYDAGRDTMYAVIDLDDDGFVRGLYTRFAVELTGGRPRTTMAMGGINAEHIWPQSMGAGQEPQRSDLYSLFPAKDNVNSARSNHPFAEISDNAATSWFRLAEQINTVPVSNINEYSESRTGEFEPREAVKGDVARAMLYFHTVHNAVASVSFWNIQRDLLLWWAASDPVSADEIERAHMIRKYQGNINPYMLDPSLIFRLWDVIVESNEPEELPKRTRLFGNYPNPLTSETTISFRTGVNGPVRLEVFNILGERVTTIEDGLKPAGNHESVFYAGGLASGIYFYTLTAGKVRETRKMVVLK